MKRIVPLALLVGLLALALPVLTALDRPVGAASSPPPETPPAADDAAAPAADGPLSDAASLLTFRRGDESMTVTMEDYLTGALAAEMPAGFLPDALMAQAVALRTFALYRQRVAPAAAHAEDVCADSSCCAAWRDEAALREKWGDDYDACIVKIRSAVNATDGVYLTWDGAPALAAFHSSSAGSTEPSDAVWSMALPYLTRVESPETAADVPNYHTAVTVAPAEFAAAVRGVAPAADFSGDPEGWIAAPVYDASGRLQSVKLGGAEVTGKQLRALFALRSTAVALRYEDGAVVMNVTGYGHGVGMSQYGANVMAARGAGWREILAWYYPGTALAGPAA